MGVQGVCEIEADGPLSPDAWQDPAPGADGSPVLVHFGSLDFIRTVLPAGPRQQQLER